MLNKPEMILRNWVDINKIDYLNKYPEKIYWNNLYINPNAINILENEEFQEDLIKEVIKMIKKYREDYLEILFD